MYVFVIMIYEISIKYIQIFLWKQFIFVLLFMKQILTSNNETKPVKTQDWLTQSHRSEVIWSVWKLHGMSVWRLHGMSVGKLHGTSIYEDCMERRYEDCMECRYENCMEYRYMKTAGISVLKLHGISVYNCMECR